MAKKAKKSERKTAPKKTAPKKTVSKKTAKRSVKRASKRASKPEQSKAAKTKVAARAAASRKSSTPAEQSRLKSAAKIGAGIALLAMDEVLKRLPWARNENDPITLLESDHRHFEKLLDEGEQTTERAKKGRREILAVLTKELNIHEALEEQIFYPALEPHAEAHDLVLESFQEHHVADQLVTELRKLEKDDEKWGAKFKVLKENVAHHISEEEHKLFPVARGVLPKEELLALGAKMRALRTELEK